MCTVTPWASHLSHVTFSELFFLSTVRRAGRMPRRRKRQRSPGAGANAVDEPVDDQSEDGCARGMHPCDSISSSTRCAAKL